MKLMCLNGWGGTLHEKLLPYLGETSPDILCLQEIVHSPASEKGWLTYRDGDHILPQRANLFRDVVDVLPEHTAIFCPAAQGVLWDDDEPIPSQWGLATFVHHSLPIIGQVQDFVHKDYSPIGYGDHPRSRSAHGVRVWDYETNWAIAVLHMHGLRDLNGKMDTIERTDQAQKLLDLYRQLAKAGDLAIICGDFNVEPSSETLSILTSAGMTELVTSRGYESTRNSLYKKPGRFADYMMINREDAVKSFDVIYDPEVSDHCPLILKV
ncbi:MULTISPECIES: endonuclease/exonuclease/phosphatase family protein [unclassified Ruegeria]|uniref:endonuclease/exonuclease/phosphatase family protein n=1 Tax=unclassified Ruegeria TaxID=2625375 RepID=UPI001AD97E25|nr:MULTISPECIES: endonuclease/exonuclease/phosphatase family protein [unclassified Ruegeria]MBO9410781.1 endonuclease/exonuclease/phosphatase family protein [Ruegeria sp. R8_1]MBO9414982.1 endonuclease/exonuclease/phosphatase family protein [Ruegeria sp. R8_2]